MAVWQRRDVTPPLRADQDPTTKPPPAQRIKGLPIEDEEDAEKENPNINDKTRCWVRDDVQWQATWENFVHEQFRDRPAATAKRQRDLVLDLSTAPEPVPAGKIADLTPRLARHYAGRSAKTLQRDLADVEGLSLVERTAAGVRARRELILAFLPWRRGAAQNAEP